MPRHTEAVTHNFEYNDCGVSVSIINILHNEVINFSFIQYVFLNDNAFFLHSENNEILL